MTKRARTQRAQETADQDRTAAFSATGVIQDRETSFADVVEEPNPGIGRPWLTD